jgi:drug/metabolite transporter (DMT)-like permease
MIERLCGLALALAAAGCYGLAIVIQAREAKALAREQGARARLLVRLAARRRWWIGTAVGLAGWPLQTAALTLAPLALVQPALAAGPVVVLALAVRILGERAGRHEIAGAAAIALGVTLLTLAAPERHAGAPARGTALAIVALCALGLLPATKRLGETAGALQLVAAAGLAYAGSGLASKLAADGLARHALVVAAIAVTLAALTGAVGASAEMSAFQRLAAGTVAPITFALEIAVPVALAPWLTRDGGHSPLTATVTIAGLLVVVAGVTVLARSPAVAHTLAASGTADA